MGEVRHPRLHPFDERNGAIDVAEKAMTQSPASPSRRRRGHESEAKGQIIVAAGLEQDERPFELIARFTIIAGKPACEPRSAWATPTSGRSGLASTSLRKTSA